MTANANARSHNHAASGTTEYGLNNFMQPSQTADPFAPLFTIRRSGRVEVVVYGILSVTDGRNRLMSVGDTGFELWSRSLLKPWQLLTNYQILKDNYPALKDEHFALFMASHSADAEHLRALEEVLAICQISEDELLCPPARPLDTATRELMRERGEKPRRRYHNCSGKHSGYLAAIKATGGNRANYLVESEEHHSRLKTILADLLGRRAESFAATTDGCQLPNYALTVGELSHAYLTLLTGKGQDNHLSEAAKENPIFAPYAELGQLMLHYPRMISGKGRLDYKIMSKEIFAEAPAMVAKEGADGLLGIGVEPSNDYPDGLGITIKLSAGFDTHHMELITREILTSFGLVSAKPEVTRDVRVDHIQSEFHFL